MLRLLKTIIDKIIDYLFYFMCILMFLAFVLVCSEVILRFAFDRSIGWVTEVTEYILVFSTYLGAAYILKKGGHVNIDILTNFLNPGPRKIVNCITDSVAALFCGAIAWFGFKAVIFHFQHGTLMADKTLSLPTAPMLAILPLGFLFLAIQFVRLVYRQIRLTQRGEN